MKTIKEIYRMIYSYQDPILIYICTERGDTEWQNILCIEQILDGISKEDYDKYRALNAAYKALYKELENNSNNYVKEVRDSEEFKRVCKKTK